MTPRPALQLHRVICCPLLPTRPCDSGRSTRCQTLSHTAVIRTRSGTSNGVRRVSTSPQRVATARPVSGLLIARLPCEYLQAISATSTCVWMTPMIYAFPHPFLPVLVRTVSPQCPVSRHGIFRFDMQAMGCAKGELRARVPWAYGRYHCDGYDA